MEKTEMTADLVVIGGGAAGMPAALEAIEQGVKSVLLLDKQAVPGGNARMAGGFMFASDAYTQKEAGVTLRSEDVYRETMAFHHCDGINPRVLRAFINRSADNMDWLLKKGIKYVYNPMMGNGLEGAGAPGSYAKVLDVLRKEFLDRGGIVLTKTAANKILLDDNGAVCGVVATDKDGCELTVHTRAVILSPGGFMGNNELMRRYFSDQYDPDVYATDAIGYSGDGIAIAEEVGALMAPKATLCKESGFSFCRKRNRPHRVSMMDGALWINADGVRFCDESTAADHTNANLLVMQPGMFGWALFDKGRVDYVIDHPTPLVNNMFLEPGDPLIRTQLEEAAAETPELCCMANSWEELAEQAGVDPEVLVSTVQEYNEACEKGHDDIFGKSAEHLKALTEAPFYAVKFTPLMIETIGPVIIDHNFRVLRKSDRKPIPGLYAGGAITSGWQGHDYELWGANLGYGMSSGRIAADHIAHNYLTD